MEWKHPASGKLLRREVVQPHVESFRDCFDQFKPFDLFSKKPHAFQPRPVRGKSIAGMAWDALRGERPQRETPSSVGPGCWVQMLSGDFSLDVSCADWVLSRVAESGIILPGKPMSFAVIEHDNGWCLVTVGACGFSPLWLAYIRSETVPQRTVKQSLTVETPRNKA